MTPLADFKCDTCGAKLELPTTDSNNTRPHEDEQGNACEGQLNRVWSFRTLRGSSGEPPR